MVEKKDQEKLLVAVRIRPMKNEEKLKGCKVCAEKFDEKMVAFYAKAKNPNNVLGDRRNSNRHYVFDYVFGSDATQEEVYLATIKPLVKNVLNGYNATAFAYGATGGGKTYTMVGTEQHPGCMVRAIDDLFQALQNDDSFSYDVSMSYLEIYNENIRDLLDPTTGYLELRDDQKGKPPHVVGLSEVSTESTQEIMKLLKKGNKERTEEATAANKNSSRSHAILIVNVKQMLRKSSKLSEERENAKFGRLYLIDLAGSEKASQTKNAGLRLREGAHINRALLALGNCINALAENKTKFVNYRDSKLTRLLKESLSGNCYTAMIAHVSPCNKHREESRNTLVYADRAKNISNKVRPNVLDVSYHVSQYQNLISDLRSEIGRLKEKIVLHGGEDENGRNKYHSKTDLKDCRDAMVSNFKDQMKMRHRLLQIDNHLLYLTMEFEKQNIIINDWAATRAKIIADNVPKKEERKSKKRNEDYESGIEDMEEPLKDKHEEDEEEDYEIYMPEPEEVKNAWTELIAIQKDQERYNGSKMDLELDLKELHKIQTQLENDLPSHISNEEEKEILSLLCRVHELEIEKIEIQREGYLKEHEVRKRDLLILKYDKQRHLCDEIISRQKRLIEGNLVIMPPELMEMYKLYQQELELRNSDKQEADYLYELNTMLRTPSTLSLRESEPKIEKCNCPLLPPIIKKQEGDEKLFESRRNLSEVITPPYTCHHHSDDSLSITSTRPTSSELGINDLESGIPPLPPISSNLYRSQSVSDDIHSSNSYSIYKSVSSGYIKSRIPRKTSNGSIGTNSNSPVPNSPINSKPKVYGIPRRPKARKEGKHKARKSRSRHSDPLANIGIPIMRY